ncbi:MAG: methyltransferase domain-containing protein [Planctomycetia bacterium]|nr:methyltransferase domain-containing protein [Planctomycetia bacterium]
MRHLAIIITLLSLLGGRACGEPPTGVADPPAPVSGRPVPGRRLVRPPTIDTAVDLSVPIPPPLTHFMGREIAQTMHYTGAPWLVRESRQREEDCRQLLEALEIRPGQTICDLGCGNGFYTVELARRVGPEGIVYAVDIQPEMLRMLARLAAEQGLGNIRPILGTVIDPRVPPDTCDLVLCVDVYHEFSHPEPMLARIRASLAAGGRLVLAEFRGEDPAVPIKPLHKMTKAQIRSELEPAGFAVAREFDQLPWQHLVFLEAERQGDSPKGGQPTSRP